MASQQELAISPAPRVAFGAWLRLASGLLLCIVIAAAAIVAAHYAPVVGAQGEWNGSKIISSTGRSGSS